MSKKLSTKMKNHREHTAERSVIKRTRRKHENLEILNGFNDSGRKR